MSFCLNYDVTVASLLKCTFQYVIFSSVFTFYPMKVKLGTGMYIRPQDFVISREITYVCARVQN